MKKNNFIVRLLLFPFLLLLGVVFAFKGLWSLEALGKTLKESGEYLLGE